jgi:predicted small lipoprotein YifL
MKKIFSIIMLAAAVSLVTLSACGDASEEASPEASEKLSKQTNKKIKGEGFALFFCLLFCNECHFIYQMLCI